MTYIPATMIAALETAREIERARRRVVRPHRAAGHLDRHHISRRGGSGGVPG
jgi:hypothetical protein